jgi:hypothetical protein
VRLIRVLPVALALCGCSRSVTPAVSVMPNLEALPAGHRGAAVVANAAMKPGRDARKPLSRNQRRAVTAASSAAAVVGWLFSKSANTTIGLGLIFDEPAQPTWRSAAGTSSADPEPPPVSVPPGQLVPWVELGPPDGSRPPTR